jgi:hypothetical protein
LHFSLGLLKATLFLLGCVARIGYAFSGRYVAFAGHRVLKVDYSNGKFPDNVVRQEPVVGLNIRF